MNGMKKHIIILRFTRRERKDGMTRGSRRRSSPLEIRYYFLILGLNYSGMENFGANGEGPFKVISTSSHGVVTLQTDEGTLFKVNGHHLKIFLEPKKPPEDLDEVDFLILP